MQVDETNLLPNEEAEAWQASGHTRRWLLFGMFAALADGGLQAISSALELRFWEHEGLTPATLIGYVAILPQLVLLTVWLILAKEVDGRGLWKSAAGFFACGWLGLLLGLATYANPPPWLAVSVLISVGTGIVGIVIFLFGKWPVFRPSGTAIVGTSHDASENKKTSGPGCMGHLVIGGTLIAIKILLRNNKQWLWWVPGDVESWTFFEILVLLVLLLVFGVWFAMAKIRLRRRLGGWATVLGGAELLIAALHLAMIGIGVGALAMTVLENPDIDDAAVDKLFASKAKMAIVVSGASYCVWSVMTILFFASVRRRSEPDWRLEFRPETPSSR